MTLKQASKIYFRAAVVVLPIWVLSLYAIEAILENAMGFPENACGWKYHSIYHFGPFALEPISLMAIAMLLLLRRAVGKYPDCAYFIEIPLIALAHLFFMVISDASFTFQNSAPEILFCNILFAFASTLFLFGVMVVLSVYWDQIVHKYSVEANDPERLPKKNNKWRVIMLYICTVFGLLILNVFISFVMIKMTSLSSIFEDFFMRFYFYKLLLIDEIISILKYLDIDSPLIFFVAAFSVSLIIIVIIAYFLLHRILSIEPHRVYRVEIPIITTFFLLFRLLYLALTYIPTPISISNVNVADLFPSFVNWLLLTITAYVLIRVKNRLQL